MKREYRHRHNNKQWSSLLSVNDQLAIAVKHHTVKSKQQWSQRAPTCGVETAARNIFILSTFSQLFGSPVALSRGCNNHICSRQRLDAKRWKHKQCFLNIKETKLFSMIDRLISLGNYTDIENLSLPTSYTRRIFLGGYRSTSGTDNHLIQRLIDKPGSQKSDKITHIYVPVAYSIHRHETRVKHCFVPTAWRIPHYHLFARMYCSETEMMEHLLTFYQVYKPDFYKSNRSIKIWFV